MFLQRGMVSRAAISCPSTSGSSGGRNSSVHRGIQRTILAQSTSSHGIGDTRIDSDRIVYSWCAGEDSWDFDRKDEAPLALPKVAQGRVATVTLVRHGQSTWNARNRVQGSSDFSVLTEKGISQAQESAQVLSQLLQEQRDLSVYVSPLKRARQTADIILQGYSKEVVDGMCVIPSLREIDLYSFQGMDKYSTRAANSKEYAEWKSHPAEFEIDGHAPVRELWYRASLAWQKILAAESDHCLVVAHNAVNQALICTALGLPPSMFRRIQQSNASFSQLQFTHDDVRVQCINSFPVVSMMEKEITKSHYKLVLVCGGTNDSSSILSRIKDVDTMLPCMVAVGTPGEQVVDVMTALEASLSSSAQSGIVAIADAEACDEIVRRCVSSDTDTVLMNQCRFDFRPGSATILSFTSKDSGHANLVCSNYTSQRLLA